MKVTFIYPDFMKGAEGKYYEGIASLSAVLKKGGHSVRLLHVIEEINPQELAEGFKRDYADTDIIAFSSTTNAFPYVAQCARQLRKLTNILILCGGLHPTLAPEEAIAVEGIDIICQGEGEYPLLELCDKLQNNQDISAIENLWIKKGDNIIRNNVRPLIENLDELPLPDRDVFDYKSLADYRWGRLVFMASRGCPFHCTHCCNRDIQQVYPNKLKYVRFKSVDRIISEVKAAMAAWPDVKENIFHDDILTLKKNWFGEFASRYKKEIGIPYICNSRFELLSEETLKSLSESGCSGLKVGVESGNDFIRKDILKRKQNREDMIKVADTCRRLGLRLHTFNMVGIPFEDLSKALDTVKVNARLRPAEIQITVFYPFPQTELHRICKERNFLTGKTLDSFAQGETILQLDTFPPKEIIHAYRNFVAFVRYYEIAYFFPRPISSVFIKIWDLFWYNPKIFFLLRPFQAVFLYCYSFIWRFKSWLKRRRV